MAAVFTCISELDIGQETSTTVTATFYQELFGEVLRVGDCVILLKHELTSDHKSPLPSELIDIKQYITGGLLARLRKQAQKGFCMAVVLPDAEVGLHALALRGYERCTKTSSGSEVVIQGWIAWLEQYLPEANGVLVFGHDFEPAFVFERVETKL